MITFSTLEFYVQEHKLNAEHRFPLVEAGWLSRAKNVSNRESQPLDLLP